MIAAEGKMKVNTPLAMTAGDSVPRLESIIHQMGSISISPSTILSDCRIGVPSPM